MAKADICLRQRSIRDRAYRSIGVTSLAGWGRTGAPGGGFQGYRGGGMQDLGYELPRIPIPRTRVNKGKKKGRGLDPQPFTSLRAVELLTLSSIFKTPYVRTLRQTVDLPSQDEMEEDEREDADREDWRGGIHQNE